jgi:hypothetical protein
VHAGAPTLTMQSLLLPAHNSRCTLVKLLRAQAFHDAGWTRREVLNLPNALSMARLVSGPVVAHLILQHQWPAALVTLTVAGTVVKLTYPR